MPLPPDNPSDAKAAGKPPKLFSVSELNRIIKDLLEQTFYPFWIQGEVSNLTLHRSGHVYFTLKDSASQIKAVFFRGVATAQQLGLAEGMAVEVLGRLTVYEPSGQYQLVIDRIRPKGAGQLQQRFEELKRRLAAEGLFDPAVKRKLPFLPRCVGIVTSPTGAAIQDFLRVLHRRFPNMPVLVAPARVQGEGAAAGGGLAANRPLAAVREDGAQALADQFVVVGEQDGRGFHARLNSCREARRVATAEPRGRSCRRCWI